MADVHGDDADASPSVDVAAGADSFERCENASDHVDGCRRLVTVRNGSRAQFCDGCLTGISLFHLDAPPGVEPANGESTLSSPCQDATAIVTLLPDPPSPSLGALLSDQADISDLDVRTSPVAGEDDHDHDVEEPPKANCEGGGKDTVDDRQRTLLDEFRSTKKSKGN
jgi:hypothetical protein